ncbi:MAG: hypothetical protein ABSC38_03515 [Verrucomicrobiia bacterium]
MKKLIFLTLLLSWVTPSHGSERPIADLLVNQYELSLISRDDNHPNIDVTQDNLYAILVLLHHGVPPNLIRAHFKWTEDEWQKRLGVLEKSEYVKKSADGQFVPSIMIMTLDDGRGMKNNCGDLAEKTAASIEQAIPSIKDRVALIGPLKRFSFQELSLLILSDVMLDQWQINNVEREFMRKDRPLRHGKHYYAALQEKSKGATGGAFGIYGNQVERHDNFYLCYYGNQRYTKEAQERRDRLKNAFSADGTVSCPILDDNSVAELDSLAASFKPKLLTLLNEFRPYLEKQYSSSRFATEISFEEYAIWWYHIFYSAVTDQLIQRGSITLPEGKVAFYFVRMNSSDKKAR